MVIAKSPSLPVEGAPPWLNAVLAAIPLILGALATLIYALRGQKPPAQGPPDPPPPPAKADPSAPTAALAVPVPMPTTPAEKLEWAEKYVERLERNEAELTARARLLEARAEQLQSMVEQLREQVDWFRDRAREQADANRYLRSMLDRQPPPPSPPPGPPGM